MSAPCGDRATLARNLATLEGKLSDLEEARTAMMAVRGLVAGALHTGNQAHEATNAADFYDPSYVFWQGYQALDFIARKACREIVEVSEAFVTAAKGDEAVAAAMEAIHSVSPLGPVWTGEEYPSD